MMLANLCGFGGWEIMTYAVEALPPSPVDEKVSVEVARARMSHHLKVLVGGHEFDPAFAVFIVSMICPTSGLPWKSFTLEDEMELSADQLQTLESFAHEFAQSDMGHQYAEAHRQPGLFDLMCEPSRTRLALALCGDTEPLLWTGIFEALGWEYEEIDEIPDFDEASFVIFDQILGQVPVYITPLSLPPAIEGEPVERTQRLQRAACVGDYMATWSDFADFALMLMRWPCMKIIDGRWYCHAGSVYNGEANEWQDLYFNLQCNSLGTLLELNDHVTDIHQGHPAVEDIDGSFSALSSIYLSGYEPDDFPDDVVKFVQAKNEETGWFMQMVHEDDDA